MGSVVVVTDDRGAGAGKLKMITRIFVCCVCGQKNSGEEARFDF